MFCNQSLEGIWKPSSCADDPIIWDWVLRDAPLSFQRTPALKEIYSPDNKSALTMLCERGLCFRANKAQEIIGLFLGKEQTSKPVAHNTSSTSEPDRAVRNCDPDHVRGKCDLDCAADDQTLHVANKSVEANTQKGMVWAESSRNGNNDVVSTRGLQSSPLDRLFPFMQRSSGNGSGSKENSEPQPHAKEVSWAIPTNPPGISRPEKPLHSPEGDETGLSFPFSQKSHESLYGSWDGESKVFPSTAYGGHEQKPRAKKMPWPPGFHPEPANRTRFAISFLTNSKETSGREANSKRNQSRRGEKYVPPHMQGRP